MKQLKSFLLLLLFFSHCGYGNESHDREDPTKSKRVTPIVLAVSKVLASVVNVSTERIVTQRYQRFGYADPFTDFFNRFFGFQHKDYTTSSLGSGVIVDKRGLVLTNNHVIQRASRIIITLSDGSDFVAKPIATDEQNDLALLSLEGISDLTPLQAIGFAVPDDLLLGETVIAVGNPFGLGHSVSTGVISAIRRKVIYDGDVLFDDILQTDAAINPGNSGGPIINVNGELIGINLAIHADAEGIGFAIPLKRIEEVLASWLIPSRFGLNSCGLIPGTVLEDGHHHKVKIETIIPDSPAAKSDLKVGDIVQSFNGAKVYQAIDIGRKLWSLSAGDPVFIKLEDGRNIEFLVDTIAKLDDKEFAMKKLQVELQELTNRLANALGLPYSRGLVVSGVSKESALAKQGVQRGDVIIQVGEIPITDFTDLVRALNRHRHERVIDVIVDRVVTVRGHIILHRYILNIPI